MTNLQIQRCKHLLCEMHQVWRGTTNAGADVLHVQAQSLHAEYLDMPARCLRCNAALSAALHATAEVAVKVDNQTSKHLSS